MNSIILDIAERFLFPAQWAFAIYYLLRGHQAPGGGFIAGLMIAAAYLLRSFARPERWRYYRERNWGLKLLILGWLMAIGSGAVAWCFGEPWMTGKWGPGLSLPILGELKLSSVVIFDSGVFFLVWGMVLHIVIHWEDRAA